MNSNDPYPKLPTWLFIATDLALIAIAGLIAYASRPMTTTMMLVVVGCIGAGAILGLVPLIARYERLKNETLDDRQRALEALARTVSSSAEQISIAANGLNEIGELMHRNLKHAEQLPHKLQEKVAEFQAQLATVQDAEKEELERELLALRTSESERLDSVSQRIVKTTADWVKLEASANQHLAAANEALGKVSLGTANAIGKAQAAAEQALSQARVEAARTIGEAGGQAGRAIETAKAAALSELDARLTTGVTALIERIGREVGNTFATATRQLDQKIGELKAAAKAIPATAPAAVHAESSSGSAPERSTAPQAAEPAPATPPADEPVAAVATADASINGTSHESPPSTVPKRTRKARREDAPAAPATTTAPADTSPAIGSAPASPAPSGADEPAPGTPVADATEVAAAPPPAPAIEPAPIPSQTIPEVSAVAPSTSQPFPNADADAGAAPAVETAKPARKRVAARQPETSADEPSLGLEVEPPRPPGVTDRVVASDGATRLLVTAYIGIGNRLFIRGNGPGMSWEKGQPLQFVSIGKWRWETNDANGPVEFKLYKNDDLECAALGAQTLEPGHQQEVNAAF